MPRLTFAIVVAAALLASACSKCDVPALGFATACTSKPASR
ncbi:MAG: hypothetical protein ACRC7C_17400 [Beijerinckiaceae bacterium]